MDGVELAEGVLEATASWFPYPVNPKAVQGEELILSGLARCRRLLQGMVELHAQPDLTGGFARTLYELWLSCTYLLLAGDEAYGRLAMTDQELLRKQGQRVLDHLAPRDDPAAQRMWRQAQQAVAQPKAAKGELSVAAMADVVTKLLRKAKRQAVFPLQGYTALYGPESYVSVHGGLGAMKQHLLKRGVVQPYVTSEGPGNSAADHRLQLASAMVMSLADGLAERLDVDRTKLDDLARRWQAEGPTGPSS